LDNTSSTDSFELIFLSPDLCSGCGEPRGADRSTGSCGGAPDVAVEIGMLRWISLRCGG
jgi:hypothetical protein